MQIKKNLKHILIVSCISLGFIFGALNFFGKNFTLPLTHFFVYRDNITLLNWLYMYTFKASVKDIVIIKIDDTTLNSLQASSDLKMLRIPKSIYRNLIENLESV